MARSSNRPLCAESFCFLVRHERADEDGEQTEEREDVTRSTRHGGDGRSASSGVEGGSEKDLSDVAYSRAKKRRNWRRRPSRRFSRLKEDGGVEGEGAEEEGAKRDEEEEQQQQARDQVVPKKQTVGPVERGRGVERGREGVLHENSEEAGGRCRHARAGSGGEDFAGGLHETRDDLERQAEEAFAEPSPLRNGDLSGNRNGCGLPRTEQAGVSRGRADRGRVDCEENDGDAFPLKENRRVEETPRYSLVYLHPHPDGLLASLPAPKRLPGRWEASEVLHALWGEDEQSVGEGETRKADSGQEREEEERAKENETEEGSRSGAEDAKEEEKESILATGRDSKKKKKKRTETPGEVYEEETAERCMKDNHAPRESEEGARGTSKQEGTEEAGPASQREEDKEEERQHRGGEEEGRYLNGRADERQEGSSSSSSSRGSSSLRTSTRGSACCLLHSSSSSSSSSSFSASSSSSLALATQFEARSGRERDEALRRRLASVGALSAEVGKKLSGLPPPAWCGHIEEMLAGLREKRFVFPLREFSQASEGKEDETCVLEQYVFTQVNGLAVVGVSRKTLACKFNNGECPRCCSDEGSSSFSSSSSLASSSHFSSSSSKPVLSSHSSAPCEAAAPGSSSSSFSLSSSSSSSSSSSASAVSPSLSHVDRRPPSSSSHGSTSKPGPVGSSVDDPATDAHTHTPTTHPSCGRSLRPPSPSRQTLSGPVSLSSASSSSSSCCSFDSSSTLPLLPPSSSSSSLPSSSALSSSLSPSPSAVPRSSSAPPPAAFAPVSSCSSSFCSDACSSQSRVESSLSPSCAVPPLPHRRRVQLDVRQCVLSNAVSGKRKRGAFFLQPHTVVAVLSFEERRRRRSRLHTPQQSPEDTSRSELTEGCHSRSVPTGGYRTTAASDAVSSRSVERMEEAETGDFQRENERRGEEKKKTTRREDKEEEEDKEEVRVRSRVLPDGADEKKRKTHASPHAVFAGEESRGATGRAVGDADEEKGAEPRTGGLAGVLRGGKVEGCRGFSDQREEGTGREQEEEEAEKCLTEEQKRRDGEESNDGSSESRRARRNNLPQHNRDAEAVGRAGPEEDCLSKSFQREGRRRRGKKRRRKEDFRGREQMAENRVLEEGQRQATQREVDQKEQRQVEHSGDLAEEELEGDDDCDWVPRRIPIYACVRGILLEFNSTLLENPSLLLSEPEHSGWVLIAQPSKCGWSKA